MPRFLISISGGANPVNKAPLSVNPSASVETAPPTSEFWADNPRSPRNPGSLVEQRPPLVTWSGDP